MRITRLLAAATFSGAALVVSLPAHAQNQWYDPRWEALSPSERMIIDRVAAEIYVDAVRAQQFQAAGSPYGVRSGTPHYRTLADIQKAPFRAYAINQLTGQAPHYVGGYAQPAPQYQPPQNYAPPVERAMANEI